MNEDRLQAWLRRADGDSAAVPDGLAERLRSRRRARRRNRALAGAFAVCAVGAGLWAGAGRKPAAVAAVPHEPAANAEAAALVRRAEALAARIAAIEIPSPPLRRAPAPFPPRIRRELADARSAALLAWHAERRLNVAGDKADAMARFRAIVELFPETPAGLSAVAYVERLSKEVM